MVMSEGVLESTPSRLGLLNAVIEVLELADGDVAPCGGAGCRRRTQDLADLVEREAHLADKRIAPTSATAASSYRRCPDRRSLGCKMSSSS
jgi:hypothetical protein